MIEQADVCIVAADPSKLRRKAFVKISDLSVADFIVTSCDLEKEELSILSENEINFINATK